MLEQAELTKYLREILNLEIDTQKRLDRNEMFLERRWGRQNKKLFEDLKQQVLKGIMQLDSTGGIIDKTARNIANIKKNNRLIKRITKSISQEGAMFLGKDGKQLQELSLKAWDEREAINSEFGIDNDFSIPPDAVLDTILNRSIRIYGDTVGTYATEITNGLIRQVVAGTSRDKLVKEYTRIIPAIDKPKRGGGRYRLSAFARSLMTVRTELIRAFNDTTDNQAQRVLGKNYYIQNINPQDKRTSAICNAATNAGVIKRSDMIDRYGLPSRHPNCRCSIAPVPNVIVEQIGVGNKI